jgi:hypothetical protein
MTTRIRRILGQLLKGEPVAVTNRYEIESPRSDRTGSATWGPTKWSPDEETADVGL